MQQRDPQDQPPYGYDPPVRRRSENPMYTIAPAQPTVVVNVIQQGPRKAVTKKRRKTKASHQLLLIICTGGIWLVAEPVIWLWHQLGPRKKVSTTYYE